MKRRQPLRNEAVKLLFNWKTTFNTSFNPVFPPRPRFAPAQGRETTLDGLGSVTQPVPASLHAVSFVGSRQLFNLQAWRLLQQANGGGRWAWIHSYPLRACVDLAPCLAATSRKLQAPWEC